MLKDNIYEQKLLEKYLETGEKGKGVQLLKRRTTQGTKDKQKEIEQKRKRSLSPSPKERTKLPTHLHIKEPCVVQEITHLTKEYKKVTGETLSLTKDGEIDILVQSISRQRTDVCANQHYKIGGLGDVVGVEEVDRNKDPQIKDLDSAIKNFMQTT